MISSFLSNNIKETGMLLLNMIVIIKMFSRVFLLFESSFALRKKVCNI